MLTSNQANSFLLITDSEDKGSLYTKESDFSPKLILQVEKE